MLVNSESPQESIWEAEFKSRYPVLHCARVSTVGDSQKTPWRDRVRKIENIAKNTRLQKPPPSGIPVCDVVLFKHPSSGFMMKLGRFRNAVVAYGLRKVENVVSSAEELLRPFGLPVDDQFPHDLSIGLVAHTLALVSVDDIFVSIFSELEDLASAINDVGEFSHWRFAVLPAGETLDSLPAECLLRTQPSPSAVLC
eukprot:CAMPEP_0172627392 /NCGR_PEP_ID=MMETSP1068-20121228/155978_1 /TAXON_ID=35684 /ORGANISM="Pseudopedinella elastica, Strain CCMP716" /LENGTH=196 /DNA_ID=CAMNT_0013437259 /DNA_START=221 /DNA_END=808 /DNA_ORIENTATION=+